MRYRIHLIASNDYEELEIKLNDWIRRRKPRRIHRVEFVANGSLYTYCVLVLFSVWPAKVKA